MTQRFSSPVLLPYISLSAPALVALRTKKATMSVFGMIRKGRQAAKEHKAKEAEKEKKEQVQVKAPYKHVPRHAAIDAMAGGPASYREADRQKIQEQNRRRSALTASGYQMPSGMSTPVHLSMTRVNSTLSNVSFPSGYASPVVQMPRSYSYGGVSPGWSHQGGEMAYTPLDHPVLTSSKGKGVERILIDSGRASRSSSNGSSHRTAIETPVSNKGGAASPVGSSSGSTSSQDDLEMKAPSQSGKSQPPAIVSVKPVRPTSEAADYFHRLHPASHARRPSDPYANGSYYPPQTRSGRPGPPSRSSSSNTMSGGIPPVPLLPIQFNSAMFAPSIDAAAAGTATTTPGNAPTAVVNISASSSLAAKIEAPVYEDALEHIDPSEDTAKHTGIDPATAVDATKESAATEPTAVEDLPSPPPASIPAPERPAPERKTRRLSKTPRFVELETIDSNISNLTATLGESTSASTSKRSEIQVSQRPVAPPSPTTPEASPAPAAETVEPKAKKGRLSKAMNKPVAAPKAKKTTRWSLRSNKTAVAAG